MTTGDGIVSDFKDGDDKDELTLTMTYEEQQIKKKKKKKKFGLKGLIVKPESDKDRLMKMKVKKLQKEFSEGKLVLEKTADDKQIKIDDISEN